ncbi:MAG: TetR/AcrR family transcriptional regulator [Polyangiaceae bacterium]|nr:TetR/AcrR family transcriptional regulator [Polyangiaceae bacterium]
MVEEALALIEERGHASFTLREVARRIGVSHAAPYRHFADKRALMTELAILAMTELADRIRAALDAAGPDLRARFLAAGFAYVRFALERPALFQASYSGEADPGDPRKQAAKEHCFGILLAFIADAQEAGAFPPGDAMELANGVWAMHHGMATLAAAGAFREGGEGAGKRARRSAKGRSHEEWERLRRVVDDGHARLLDGLLTEAGRAQGSRRI